MKVHRSARKHGVLPEDAVQAADLALWVEPLEEEEWPGSELRLGFDTQARLLETVVLIFRSGEEMVIHAMPARRKYGDLLP
ncbi:toxin [Ornithinimicrobium sufpigmenti]|uniref:toxin n=1 Tax=Ornithinimicrobium sufpigmenti TaxID=2508882 RepID=UPI0010369C27|nr:MULTISPECIES: toxin [unclassified Ornithinimicrobium]